jgi:hypothetical protein
LEAKNLLLIKGGKDNHNKVQGTRNKAQAVET